MIKEAPFIINIKLNQFKTLFIKIYKYFSKEVFVGY